ncbi:MAG: PIG-L deacetylase family protein [Armatimonadota bacterium]
MPTILIIQAHPDDEMQLAGTVALQTAAGLDVTIAVASNGNLGGLPGASKEERAAVRRAEMEASCALLGARLQWIGLGDDDFMARFHGDYAATEAAFRNVIRRVDPDLIIIPPLDDYHHHHRATAELALNASTGASNPNVVGEEPPSSRIPYALHMTPMPPVPFVPSLYVDITETFDRKIEALRCHQSQHQYLQSHHRTDIFAQVEAVAAMHGAACGVKYAEPFAVCQRFNRPAPIQTLAQFFPSAEPRS